MRLTGRGRTSVGKLQVQVVSGRGPFPRGPSFGLGACRLEDGPTRDTEDEAAAVAAAAGEERSTREFGPGCMAASLLLVLAGLAAPTRRASPRDATRQARRDGRDGAGRG
ncbi:hypothetical protein C2W62_39135 [Candidatus Entotheonella serta]|nr:hypothetical protein C2W62_39135 [Candidatus Entotheonella serta]